MTARAAAVHGHGQRAGDQHEAQAIEAHRLCVPFVRSDANLADFFTKPLHPKRFFELRDKIMNITSPRL